MTQHPTDETPQGVAFVRLGPMLTAKSCEALHQAISTALQDDAVSHIVMIGAGGRFLVGEDLGEMGQNAEGLADLCEAIESCAKPVVAALEGTINGGGMALALAAHARIAARDTRLGFPEIRFELLPAGGVTQRLPRLLGAEAALSLLVRGHHVDISDATVRPLCDALCDGDLAHGAEQFCRQMKAPSRLSRTRDRRDGYADPRAFQTAIRTYRKEDLNEVQARCVDLVEASVLLPFDAGQAMELDAYLELESSPQSKALRYVQRLKEEAQAQAKDAAAQAQGPDTLSVLGAGPLAIQIASTALASGLRVNWGAKDQEKLDDGVEQLRAYILSRVTAAGWDPSEAHGRLANLTTGDSQDMVAGADLVIQAARGQWDVRLPPDARRALAIPGKLDGLGLRFPPPVFATRLVEVLQGPEITEDETTLALALAHRLGKLPVRVTSNGESIAGHLAEALQRASDAMLDLGASPYAVDEAITGTGWGRAPFQSRDLTGLVAAAKLGKPEGGRNWSELLAGHDRKGWVAGRGFYDWGDAGATPSDAVLELLDAKRAPKTWAARDIHMLILAALANAGIKLVASGMVRSAAEIDLVSILALDFPAAQGGVMKAASQLGLFKLMKAMQRIEHPNREIWTPHSVWQDLVKNGQNFDAA